MLVDTPDGPKSLHVRVWTCGNCGARLDRAFNAAVNIGTAGLAESSQHPADERVWRSQALAETKVPVKPASVKNQPSGNDYDVTALTVNSTRTPTPGISRLQPGEEVKHPPKAWSVHAPNRAPAKSARTPKEPSPVIKTTSDLDKRVREIAASILDGATDEGKGRTQIAWEMFGSTEAAEATSGYLRAKPSMRHMSDDIVHLCLTYIYSAVTGCHGDDANGTAVGLADNDGLFARMCKTGPRFDLQACVDGNSAQGWLRHILPKVIRGSIVPHLHTANGYVMPADPNPDTSTDAAPANVFESTTRLHTVSAEDTAFDNEAHSTYSDTNLAMLEDSVRDESEEYKALAFGREVRSHILGSAPALPRPLDSTKRRRLLAEVKADPEASIDALHGYGNAEIQALWNSWSPEHRQRLDRSLYASTYAHVVMVEALTDLPLPSAAAVKKVEFSLVGILRHEGVDPRLVAAIVSQFFKDEYTSVSWKDRRSRATTHGPPAASPYHWTTLAASLSVPDCVLPSNPRAMRDAIIRHVDEIVVKERPRVAQKNANRKRASAAVQNFLAAAVA